MKKAICGFVVSAIVFYSCGNKKSDALSNEFKKQNDSIHLQLRKDYLSIQLRIFNAVPNISDSCRNNISEKINKISVKLPNSDSEDSLFTEQQIRIVDSVLYKKFTK